MKKFGLLLTILLVAGLAGCGKSDNKTETKKEIKRIKIAGNAYVLTSKLSLDTIKKMEKLDKDALCLVEADGEGCTNEIFRIESGKIGSVSKYGIVFAEADADGNATVTQLLPEGITDKKTYIKENLAQIIFMLTDLEDLAATRCAELQAAYDELDKDIEEV